LAYPPHQRLFNFWLAQVKPRINQQIKGNDRPSSSADILAHWAILAGKKINEQPSCFPCHAQ
jgi:hypothetical protein